MDLNKLKKINYMLGPDDGRTVAFIKGDQAYLVSCHGMSDALVRMSKKFNVSGSDWMLTNEKAVLVPGIWEYEMAQFIG